MPLFVCFARANGGFFGMLEVSLVAAKARCGSAQLVLKYFAREPDCCAQRHGVRGDW